MTSSTEKGMPYENVSISRPTYERTDGYQPHQVYRWALRVAIVHETLHDHFWHLENLELSQIIIQCLIVNGYIPELLLYTIAPRTSISRSFTTGEVFGFIKSSSIVS